MTPLLKSRKVDDMAQMGPWNSGDSWAPRGVHVTELEGFSGQDWQYADGEGHWGRYSYPFRWMALAAHALSGTLPPKKRSRRKILRWRSYLED